MNISARADDTEQVRLKTRREWPFIDRCVANIARVQIISLIIYPFVRKQHNSTFPLNVH